MVAEYEHWYECREGQMPESFENVRILYKDVCRSTFDVVIAKRNRKGIDSVSMDSRYLTRDFKWKWVEYEDYEDDVIAWKITRPYIE